MKWFFVKLLFKGTMAAVLLPQCLLRDMVDERIQLQRSLAPKLQGVTLCKKKQKNTAGYEGMKL